MKRIVFLSMILMFSLLCGCSKPILPVRPAGFQDVENIATIDYIFTGPGYEYNYSFDLERGVFYFCYQFENLEDSPEYELEQSEIDAIRTAVERVEKWPGEYKNKPLISLGMGTWSGQACKIDIRYFDGTNCVFDGRVEGPDEENFEWPDGFEDLRSTFDGIVQNRLYGSFTFDKTYSYDGKYYAITDCHDHYVTITVYSSNDVLVSSFGVLEREFCGICWENDSYYLWVQKHSYGAVCYSVTNKEWTRNDSAVIPEYITGRYVY